MRPFSAYVAFMMMLVAGLVTGSANAHIDLKSPKPVMDGRAGDSRALKVGPFGAPGIDMTTVKALDAKAGAVMDLEIDVYIYHAGEIVVLYTTDMTGGELAPVMSLPSAETELMHVNLLTRAPSPCVDDGDGGCKRGRGGAATVHMQVTLPDVEGEIMLVVRQIMTERQKVLADGTVDLSSVYYHQAAKLNLVRD